MDPPAYVPSAPKRSIHDLRTQILANGAMLKPKQNANRPSDDHIELVIAKTPDHSSAASMEKRTMTRGGSTFEVASSSAAHPGKHYAVLCQRSYSKQDVKIIIKGEPRDTAEEALEWMLEKTECLMHDMIVRHGRPASDVCTVM